MDDFIAKMLVNASRTMLRVNTNTLEIRIYSLYGQRYPDVLSDQDSIQFLEKLINSGRIYKEDVWLFRFLQLPSKPLQQYLKDRGGVVLVYRYVEQGELLWSRLHVILPENFGPDNPEVLLMAYSLPREESVFFEANEIIHRDIHKIIKIDYLKGNYEIIREKRSEWYLREHLEGASLNKLLSVYQNELVHPDDAKFFRAMLNRENILKHLAEGNSSYGFYYRRKVGTMYHWVRLLAAPAVGYTPEHPVVIYFVFDEHRAILKLLDVNRLIEFLKSYPKIKTITSETYYENLLAILYQLTDKYLDCYMIDLERDLYIKYKFQSAVLKEPIPNIASYSQSSMDYIKNHASGANAESLKAYCTSDKMREAMMNRMTLEFTFETEKGELVKTIVRKIESIRGIPTKVLCYTVPVDAQHKLKVRCFGNFEVFLPDGNPLPFARKQSKQFLAYLIDKQGYPVTSSDIVEEMLEKSSTDKNAVKYVSTVVRRTIQELEAVGFGDVIQKEQKSIRVNRERLDCDYYRLLDGDVSMWEQFHNEYMKEYSWAEETAAELMQMASK